MTETGEVNLHPEGEDCDVEWKVNFASFSEEIDALYCSPVFFFEEESWHLGIWPNGRKDQKTSGYIDLRLWRVSYNSPPMNVTFSFAFKTVNGKKECQRQNTSVFEGRRWHALDQFLFKADFERRQSEFLASGSLIIVCTLRKLNTTGSASNIATADCLYCKKFLDVQRISSHEKKCRVKCPDCSDVLLLQNWNEHECQISRKEAATNTTESFIVCHHNKILQDLKQVFLKQENFDVFLRVKGEEFHAHKFILAARSPVFASTFRNDMKEKKSGIVDIEDCDPTVFPDFLCFLYSADLDNLSKENVFGLFTAADKYDIPDLREKCLEFMKETLSMNTFCKTLTIALQHSEAELVHLATDFFIENAKSILVTVEWQTFVAENPTQSNELFIKYVESVGSQNS